VTGAPRARKVLVGAALAGLVTAMPLWIPAGAVIGAAALIMRPLSERYAVGDDLPPRNRLSTTGVTTRATTAGDI
jgi:hypothetical protein